ncbi:branched-chain amino acid transport system substrate-binding protein [Variovorax sp. YR266]|uniref:ABC transporter substrate-binding protein n=1 Tax=Variovorax sp. YR266 TaxID=1884386 RepID=UPI00089671B4|nr:ABC transporter substrate-binding protein [Variovorax sp. YR266]SDZ70360.1 branched-chain amino acid transport system substrate-binding protein [Variovorax sp. YR266]
MQRRSLLKTLSGGAAVLAMPGLTLGQTQPIKIGQLTDYTGVYRDINGPGEEHAIQLAIRDFNQGKVLGRPIELVTGDHLNKADVASDIAKRWLDVEKIGMLLLGGSSVAALAVQSLAREKGAITNITSAAAVNFTEQDCSPYGFHWQVDSYAYARSAVVAAGADAKKRWFFISIDNVFGHTATPVCAAAVQESGGQVVGAVRHPINTTDYASFITQAQAARADVVVFLSAGTDLIRSLKQAREFGVFAAGKTVVAPILVYTDILAAGLDVAQGMRFADGYYWNVNDATRAFAKRYQEKMGSAPGSSHAQAYAAATHYLQAVQAVKGTDVKAVAEQMRKQPITSSFWNNASIRQNGRVVYDLNLMRVLTPAQSKGKFDVAEVFGAVTGDKVFKPLKQTECKLV